MAARNAETADQQIEQIRQAVKTNPNGFAALAMNAAPTAGTNSTLPYSATTHTDPNDFVVSCGTGAGYTIYDNYDNTSDAGGTVASPPPGSSGSTVNVNPSSAAPVRIFIDSSNSARCKNDGLGSNQGSFNDPAGFNNQFLGVGGIAAASGMQVYVVGDGVQPYDSQTTVQIGPTGIGGLLSLSALTYGAVIYAPTSKVTVNVPALCLLGICAGGVFEGAVIGNDTSVAALTITQDLDLANYPLYAGVNAFRVKQYVQCDTSVTTLTHSVSDLSGC
ncbi:MAG: hypothetical protein ACR2QA_06090 [Solirubrobacteraceae bacterium]